MAFGNRLTRWVYNNSPAPFQDFMATVYARNRSRMKYGCRFYEYLSELDRTQWYGNRQLSILQEELLRRMVWYAARHVPYYQTLFAEYGLHPQDIRCVEDLRHLPCLEKSVVQTRLGDLRSRLYLSPQTTDHFQSSGTTGRALDVYVTHDYLQMEKAFTWLHRSWAGVNIGDRVAAFVGFPIVPVTRRHPPFWVYDKTEDRMIFSLQHMGRANLPAYARKLEEFKPTFVMGYPTALYLMALFLCENGRTGIRPKAVFTGSETLLSHQRDVIMTAFGCRVFDNYGASEFVANIVECELGNYHIKAEYGVVECLGHDGVAVLPGETGELVCTGLNNTAMPLFRYRTGDMAVLKDGDCPCGRGGRLVERIVGRREDVVVTPDGRYVSRLDFVFKGLLNVEEAQLVQEAPHHLRVRYVPRSGFTDLDKGRILANLRERLGDNMAIVLEAMESIPRTANGKFRYVVSKVPLGLAGARQTGEVLDLIAEEEKTL